MSSREEFEAAMLNEFEINLEPFRKVDDTGFDGYCLDDCFTSERSQLATCAWMMWQASRAQEYELLAALKAITNSGPDAIPIKEAFEMAHRAIERASGGKV